MDYAGAHNSPLKAKSAASKQKCIKFKIHRGPAENQDSTDTLSPSSSNSDDYFQVNPKTLPKLRIHINNKPSPSTDPLKLPFHENDNNIDLSSKALYRFEESINVGSPGCTPRPRFSDITYESPMPQIQFSLTQSPPMQLMDKIMGFDPTRIPQSVFSKSSSPTDWSTASNESLFSIPIGDGSFSRDHASSEVTNPQEIGPTPSPDIKGIEPYFDIEETIRAKPEEILILDEQIGDGSNKREIQVQHFVKPKKKKSLWLPCHCGGCCLSSLCGCKWPSCSFNWCFWPSCSGICSSFRCKCPELSNCCCKCPKLSSFHCKCPELSSCCSKCPKLSSFCCTCPELSSCCCKCSKLSSCCCNFPKLSSCCCKFPNWSSCCCKCPKLSSCCCNFPKLSSCCCKFPNSSSCCCKCSLWSCCKCSSWSCFKCSSCCKCRCLNCIGACCCCWDQERETDSYGLPTKMTDGGTTNSKSSTKASSQGKSSCFSCC